MSNYSISHLEKLSGIRAHTIRIWEQRYNLLQPKRSEGNTRYYDDEDLRKLLNISVLVNSGSKISLLSRLSDNEINAMLDKIIAEKTETSDGQNQALINNLITAGINYDEFLFEKAFSGAILKYGLVEAYEKIVYPMLLKVGLMWGKSDLIPAQEHFISNLLKQKLFHAIEQTPVSLHAKETWILFLPEGENHELGLLIANFMVRSSGRRVVYLGAQVPYYNLKAAVIDIKPEYLQFFLVRNFPQKEAQTLVNRLEKDFRGINKCICGPDELKEKIKLPKDHQWVSDLQGLTKILTR